MWNQLLVAPQLYLLSALRLKKIICDGHLGLNGGSFIPTSLTKVKYVLNTASNPEFYIKLELKKDLPLEISVIFFPRKSQAFPWF